MRVLAPRIYIFSVGGVYTEPLQSTGLANWPLVASSGEEEVIGVFRVVGGGGKDLPETPAKENKVKRAWGYLIQDTGAGRTHTANYALF